MQIENNTRLQEIMIVCGLGAIARFLLKEGPLSFRLLIANLILSAFLGWGAWMIAEWKDWPSGIVGPIAGALAWLGPTAVTTFLKKFVNSIQDGQNV